MVHGRVIQRPWQHLEVQKVVPPGLSFGIFRWLHLIELDWISTKLYKANMSASCFVNCLTVVQWKWQAQKFKNSKLKMGEHFWKTWKLVPIIIFVYLRSHWTSQLRAGFFQALLDSIATENLFLDKLGCVISSEKKKQKWWWRCCWWLLSGLWYMTLFQKRAPYSSRQLVLAVISLPGYYLWMMGRWVYWILFFRKWLQHPFIKKLL